MNKKEAMLKKAEDYVSEYLRCKNDFEYFCKNYIYLELAGGDEILDPYEKQIELINHVEQNKNGIVLKTRQTGISTIFQAYCAWLTVFFKNVVIGIVSKDAPEATDFSKNIRGMIEKLPNWMFKKGNRFKKDTERSYILNNGSKLYASPVAPSAPHKTLRGKAVTFLIIDEAAFISYIDEAWTAMVPALSTSQAHARKNDIPYGTVILSTPNKTVGVGAWFYEKWTRAKSGDGFFDPFIVYWKDIPALANDPEWYENQKAMLEHNQDKIDQELELKFIPSEGAFLPRETSKLLQDNKVTPKRIFHLYDGEVWVFNDPIQERHYLIGVDTATEYGNDKSAIVVFDYETLEQCWEFVGKCKVKNLINIIKLAAGTYPNCTIVIESNSVGNQVIEEISESEYSHLMYKERRGESKLVPGLSNNAKTRPLMIDALYTYIVQFPEIIKSERLVYELVGLIKKQTQTIERVEADSGTKDDIAMASALTMYVRKYDPPMNITTGSPQSNLLSDIVDMNNPNSIDPMKEVKRKMEEGDHNQSYVDIFEIMRQ